MIPKLKPMMKKPKNAINLKSAQTQKMQSYKLHSGAIESLLYH